VGFECRRVLQGGLTRTMERCANVKRE